MQTFIDDLREVINSDNFSKQDALEFLISIEDEYQEIQMELDGFKSVDLGLDTIEYKFEKENLRIQQKFDDFIRTIKQQNGAGA